MYLWSNISTLCVTKKTLSYKYSRTFALNYVKKTLARLITIPECDNWINLIKSTVENSRLWLIECLCRWIRRLLHYEDNAPFMPRELHKKKHICQHEAIFRPWIVLSVKKTLCSFIAILLRCIKFLNRTW